MFFTATGRHAVGVARLGKPILAIAIAIVSNIMLSPSPGIASPKSFRGLVVGISDGDTIKVMHDGAPVTVRLNCIDCPEKSQDFGQVAKQYTASQCFKKVVRINETGHDRYKRSIGQVILPNKRALNLELVKRGYAWWYEQYAPHATEYQAAQNKARQKRKGLWQNSKPVPPWEFRKREHNVRLAHANTKGLDY